MNPPDDKQRPLNCDRDAERWAREFNEVLASKGQQPLDPGWLISWFASAMMCGEDTYRWRQEEAARSATVALDALLPGLHRAAWICDSMADTNDAVLCRDNILMEIEKISRQAAPSATVPSDERKDVIERQVPAPLSDCLRILMARLSDHLSPAEKRELDESADLLELSYAALGELVQRIEKCGASIELTNAVTLCSDLRMAIGNRWNPKDKYAEVRVRRELGTTDSSARSK